MKRLLLIPALMLGTMTMAKDYNYEITPLIGYNIAEGNIELDDYATFGAEFQYNRLDSIIKPELSIFYSKADYTVGGEDTDVYRLALNGVYEYNKVGFLVPLAKAGIGYESMNDGSYTKETGNVDSAFLDVGIGAKIPFNDMLALKLEAIYMLKYNEIRYDNNLAVLAGLSIAFGEKAQKAAPAEEKEVVQEEPVVVAPVDGDNDNDGVLNSVDKCPTTPAGETVDASGCKVDGDDDKDGILNSVDNCPATPVGETVDASGCKVDGDDDNDGVLNSKDICPNTKPGTAVNYDGCPVKVNLHINFENNSDVVNKESDANIQKYADFLNNYKEYSTKIVGYTDSKGSANYNQKLSEKRAKAVKNILVEKGVPANRVTSVGMGENNPVADNKTKEGRAQNRRIEAELTKN